MCSDELIRQETLNCPQRGLLAACIRDELRMNADAHKTVFEDSVAFVTKETLVAEEGKAEMEERVKHTPRSSEAPVDPTYL